ncbi:MAG: acetylglutamate kinase [Oscillospiraceae bacterium]|nr:acetylglutamate kinase [Oscillospiraceae bacterium]
MDKHQLERAMILAEALPYIQKYSGQTIVIKYGGHAMNSPELFSSVMEDLVLLSLVGIQVVVVHGGGPEISEALNKLGKVSEFIEGLRYTDQETMDIVQMVLCGKINKNLVDTLGRLGGRAIGLCGLDGGMLKAKQFKLDDGRDLGLVGEVTEVDPRPVLDALAHGYIPVISTVAQGVDGDHAYNVNADTAASKIASALGARKLILLTAVGGLLEDPNDEDSLLSEVNLSQVPNLVKKGIITGGMIPKMNCCVESVRQGVNDALILDGRVPHAILVEMFTDAGAGTMILP